MISSSYLVADLGVQNLRKGKILSLRVFTLKEGLKGKQRFWNTTIQLNANEIFALKP